MNQLANSRSRRARMASQVRTRGPSSDSKPSWKSTAALMAGAAIGGVFMFKGHMMIGSGIMLGTLLTGGLYDKSGS